MKNYLLLKIIGYDPKSKIAYPSRYDLDTFFWHCVDRKLVSEEAQEIIDEYFQIVIGPITITNSFQVIFLRVLQNLCTHKLLYMNGRNIEMINKDGIEYYSIRDHSDSYTYKNLICKFVEGDIRIK